MSNPKLAAFSKRTRRTRTIRDYISKGCIRRLARRGGVGRISALIYDETRTILRLYLERLIRDSIIYSEYFNRKTICAEDVIRALQNRGKRLYGFDEAPFPVSVRTSARMKTDAETPSCSSATASSSGVSTRSFSGPQRSQSSAVVNDSETE